jgi:hypothetical protein
MKNSQQILKEYLSYDTADYWDEALDILINEKTNIKITKTKKRSTKTNADEC